MKIISLLLSALLLTARSGGGVSAESENSFVSGTGTSVYIKIKDRKDAPVISGELLMGGNKTLAANQVKVINVWASWCAPCRAEAPTLAALAKKYKGAVFLGILTRDSEVAARAFQNRFQLPYPTLVDDSVLLKFRDTLTANAIPSTLLIDKKGRVAARISGEVTVASLSELIEKLHRE